MTVLGYILVGLGCLTWLGGNIRFLVVVYRHGLVWFLTCLFIPWTGLLFFLLHVKETWQPMLVSTAGFVVAAAGCLVGGFHFRP